MVFSIARALSARAFTGKVFVSTHVYSTVLLYQKLRRTAVTRTFPPRHQDPHTRRSRRRMCDTHCTHSQSALSSMLSEPLCTNCSCVERERPFEPSYTRGKCTSTIDYAMWHTIYG